MRKTSAQLHLKPSADQYLISFIVPVFNTEIYLEETLNSIAAYGARDIEIIIVNDGSTDNSAQTISRWVDTHDVHVKVIHQENSGLSAARMAGLAVAEGSFVGFCDSDDRLDVTVYVQMAKMAQERGCDIALCRSIVFDSTTEDSYDFYDAGIWHDILASSRCQILSGLSEPRLFRLEPNANTRLLRRSFMLQHELTFPAGLLFEDFPVHVHGIAVAHSVLLFNATGYFYRVNRHGKITDQKSSKRFDILKTVALAFDYAKGVNERGRAQVIGMACRMIYWCGAHTLNEDRSRFFAQGGKVLDEHVPISLWPFAYAACLDERERLIMSALAAHANGLLIDKSAKRRPRVKNALALLCNKYHGRLARQVAMRLLKRRLGHFIRHPARLGRR